MDALVPPAAGAAVIRIAATGVGAMTRTGVPKTPGAVRPEFRPLHKYLDGRYADRVVLTFQEIEDVLGAPLPEAARLEAQWWTDGADVAPQSQTWIQASRTAVPNLAARVVVFDRLLD